MKTIQLTLGQVALVDDNDYRWLRNLKWYAIKKNKTYYAVRDNPRIYMHRLILGLGDLKKLVDHIDQNGLNNQRSNLRLATHSENCFNSSSRNGSISVHKGVTWDKYNKRWKVRLRNKHIGYFKIETEAAVAYNKAAKELHPEFAKLNEV